MDINITGRHLTVPEKFKEKVEKKVIKLTKYNENITAAKIILSAQKDANVAEITLSGKNVHITAKDSADRMLDAVNDVVEKLETALKKERDKNKKIKLKTVKKEKEILTMEDALNLESKPLKKNVIKVGDAQVIVKTNELLKPISVDEAILILKENHLNFYAFNDINTSRVSVIYRRNDGKFGLIEM
ncbi:MAG TPA: ribosome-associated translation inhibitor RaiA [bacterium]|nr:ribosome-associated translation inhibitor RaiA [bacterium]HPN31478.1 ribosome-associated translation inhibitor RaiA [bacterium]